MDNNSNSNEKMTSLDSLCQGPELEMGMDGEY